MGCKLRGGIVRLSIGLAGLTMYLACVYHGINIEHHDKQSNALHVADMYCVAVGALWAGCTNHRCQHRQHDELTFATR